MMAMLWAQKIMYAETKEEAIALYKRRRNRKPAGSRRHDVRRNGKAGRHRQKTGCPDRAGEDRGRGLPCRSFGRKKTGRR